ncbi:ribbon-helix-helix domain-containing protein [Kocuria rhizophila]|uniref:ribbon-helix-helix domain-containing protein n=1 Tax=Kocuria rhizophila TaxID=72000 RepID=UPI000C7D7019|nr:ribbon-helix-helix domain-containing protein [Kocuria rhizophila]MCT1915767.1 ribbon-helix-helix domain-containing protein [Kocuria rhizophila]PKZ38146.1 CopG family transcriptional regulator [Kocuria rhizophila]
METVNGVPVTDEMVQEWADEAERGYDVETLRKRGRKPLGDGPARVVPVRLDNSLLAALDARAEEEHLSRSGVIRAALRSYVA